MSLTKKQRQTVWDKSKGHCWYCGCELPEKGWHADHIDPIFRETNSPTKKVSDFGDIPEDVRKELSKSMWKPQNHRIDNIVPACAPCNLFKSVFTLEDFRREIGFQTDRARKSSVNFRTAERFNLIEVLNEPVVFWFERQGLTPNAN